MTETYSPPEQIGPNNVIYWSTSKQVLEGVKQGKAIIKKALIFLKLGLVDYDQIDKVFLVHPIPNYNKTTYRIHRRDKHFACSCQFYNQVSKHWEHPTCSHIQAVKFWLEIKRWNKT